MLESTKQDNNILSPTSPEEEVFEQTLRPSTLLEFIGQESLKANLAVVIEAAKQRGERIEHVLLYGLPGLGKTTLASIIAKETGSKLKTTSGPAIERPGDLAALLTNLEPGDTLFIDEVHRLNKVVEEILYPAMEDGFLDIVIGKGPAARSVRLDLPKFTVIGATTRAGSLAAPLRDRFGMNHRLEFYTPAEIQQIIQRAATLLGSTIQPDASAMLAGRARLTPRIANRLLKRVRDYADINGDGIIDTVMTTEALQLLEIDELGLDREKCGLPPVLTEVMPRSTVTVFAG
jgi:Holliday junction DNA helicase RuvB